MYSRNADQFDNLLINISIKIDIIRLFCYIRIIVLDDGISGHKPTVSSLPIPSLCIFQLQNVYVCMTNRNVKKNNNWISTQYIVLQVNENRIIAD